MAPFQSSRLVKQPLRKQYYNRRKRSLKVLATALTSSFACKITKEQLMHLIPKRNASLETSSFVELREIKNMSIILARRRRKKLRLSLSITFLCHRPLQSSRLVLSSRHGVQYEQPNWVIYYKTTSSASLMAVTSSNQLKTRHWHLMLSDCATLISPWCRMMDTVP